MPQRLPDIPNEFAAFCGLFHQDWHLDQANAEDALRALFKGVPAPMATVVRNFTAQLLDVDYSNADLKGILNRLLPAIYIPNAGGGRALLEFVGAELR